MRWIVQVRAAALPHLQAFARGLERDLDAVIAAFTLRYRNGGTERVITNTKMIARQMYGRTGFTTPPPPHPPWIASHFGYHRK